jgi:hypothetical protein
MGYEDTGLSRTGTAFMSGQANLAARKKNTLEKPQAGATALIPRKCCLRFEWNGINGEEWYDKTNSCQR